MVRHVTGNFQGIGFNEDSGTFDMRFFSKHGYSSNTYIKNVIYNGVSLREHGNSFGYCVDSCGNGEIDINVYGIDMEAMELHGDGTDSVVFVLGSTMSGEYASDRRGELGWMRTKRFNNRPTFKSVFPMRDMDSVARWMEEGMIQSENNK
jgi:hypothetical protein